MLTKNYSNKSYGKHRIKFKRLYSTYIMHSRYLLKIMELDEDVVLITII